MGLFMCVWMWVISLRASAGRKRTDYLPPSSLPPACHSTPLAGCLAYILLVLALSLAFITRFLYLWNTISPSVSIQLLERPPLNDIVLLQPILEQGTYEETAPERFFVRH